VRTSNLISPLRLFCAFIIFHSWPTAFGFPAQNEAPHVRISFPANGSVFSSYTVIKIKTEVYDSDGSIREIRFFADSKMIGAVTNPPFNLAWPIETGGQDVSSWRIKAVATDDLGATTESEPVLIDFVTETPTYSSVQIISPRDGALFPLNGSFPLTAEVLASNGGSDVEFYDGPNAIGVVTQKNGLNATNPPVSLQMNNLPEGVYRFHVQLVPTQRGIFCECSKITNVVRVVNLGIGVPVMLDRDRLQFEVVTSYPGKEVVVEASEDLVTWSPISTNVPTGNVFTFSDSFGSAGVPRWYRAIIPDTQ
jgi:hypothetical protein